MLDNLKKYCQLLIDDNRYLDFDHKRGKRYELTQMYFPLQIGLGKYAFRSIKEQKEYAQSIRDAMDQSIPISQIETNIRITRKGFNRLEKMAFFQNNANRVKAAGDGLPKSTSVLDNEKLFPNADQNSSYLVMDGDTSRTLLIANGGGGKTTVLRRITLFYCERLLNRRLTDGDNYVENLYHLKGNLLPIFIRLRKATRADYSIANIIYENIRNVMRDSGLSDELISDLSEAKLILLIDGLDEINDQQRLLFLEELNRYLEEKPSVRIILSTRAAGLSNSEVGALLNQMNFRSRFIIPLTDEESEAYAMHWIDLAQDQKPRKRELRQSVKVIFHDDQFEYLRDFIRTPLELLMILQRISNHSTILSRYDLFSEMLREMFTNHVREDNQKEAVFNDHMNFLSYIAYHMQNSNSFYIAEKDINQMFNEQKNVGFRTEMFNNIQNHYSDVLDVIASSYGIIEQVFIDGRQMYTFPIRSYQEFLSAYACCHICLDPQLGYPVPIQIVRKHMTDSLWQGTIYFILSDLEINSSPALKAVLKEIFTQVDNPELLTDIVESNVMIDFNVIRVLCEAQFKHIRLSSKQKNLLTKCIQSRAGSGFVMTLGGLYIENPIYLEAYSTALLIWEFERDGLAVKKAFQRVFGDQAEIGAYQLCLISRIYMFETYPMYRERVLNSLYISENAINMLYEKALESQKSIYVTALTELMVTMCPGYEYVRDYLDEPLYKIVVKDLEQNYSLAEKAYFEMDRENNFGEYYLFLELFYTLGSFFKQFTCLKASGSLITLLMEKYYEISLNEFKINQVAMAVCLHNYYWDDNTFAQIWAQDICMGRPSQDVTKIKMSRRENNLFEIMKDKFVPFEMMDAQIRLSSMNIIGVNEPLYINLFRLDDTYGAIENCYRLWKSDSKTYTGHLGFLLRNAHLELNHLYPDEKRTTKEIIESGVDSKDPFCLIDLSLLYLNEGQEKMARKYLKRINKTGWKALLSVWQKIMWEEMSSDEGVLVCALAEKYGGIPITDPMLKRRCLKLKTSLLIE